VCNSGGKIKRARATAAATRSLSTAAAFGDIILYGGAGNFPNVEHLFVRSFMTRAARGGYWRGPVDRRRLVAVVVRVAVVALPLSGHARTHSVTHTNARAHDHTAILTRRRARANRLAHAQRRRRPRWPALETGRARRAGRRRRPRPRRRCLVPSARRPIDGRAGLVCVCVCVCAAARRQRALAAYGRSFFVYVFFCRPRARESMIIIIIIIIIIIVLNIIMLIINNILRNNNVYYYKTLLLIL